MTIVTGKTCVLQFSLHTVRDEKCCLNHHDHVETSGWPELIEGFTLPSVGESGSLEKAGFIAGVMGFL